MIPRAPVALGAHPYVVEESLTHFQVPMKNIVDPIDAANESGPESTY